MLRNSGAAGNLEFSHHMILITMSRHPSDEEFVIRLESVKSIWWRCLYHPIYVSYQDLEATFH